MSSIAFVISNYIGENRVLEALDVAKTFLKERGAQDTENELTQLRGQWMNAYQQHSQGLLGRAEFMVENNRIAKRVLHHKDKIKAIETVQNQTKVEIRDPEITALIYANAHAGMAKNIDGVMATLHPEMPTFQQVYQQTLQFFQFQMTDLFYDVQKITILSKDDQIATAEVHQHTTTKLAEAPFRENQIVQIYTFQKYQGFWKITDTILKSVEYFDV